MHESPIARDNLLVTDVESILKLRVPKLLLECSMQQFHNELIASPDDGGLLEAIHADTNDVIISDIMICSLSPPQPRPITDNQKMMYGCAICNTSKYFQELLNECRRKQLKTMKDKSDNSHGRKKDEFTPAHKSYNDYVFPNNETRHPR